jgi:hypothetical protein
MDSDEDNVDIKNKDNVNIKNENVDIENMDDLINQYVETKKYRNKSELSLQWPFRCLVVGASSLGKTNVVLNIILKQLDFDKIYLYFKDETEDKYQFLISYFTSIEKQYNEENDTDDKIIEWSTNPEEIVKCDELDENKQNLIVIDDMVVDKHQEQIEDLFIRCRKRNTSIIYQTQNLFKTPQNIKKNCNYVILFSTNKGEMREIAKQYGSDLDSKEFIKIYQDAIREPFGWMLIDSRTPHLPLRYRSKFDGLYIPPN